MRHPLAALLILALLSSVAWAGFEIRTLGVDIAINPDGSAHATESISLFMNSSESIDIYTHSMEYNYLSAWSNRTGLDIRAHVTYVDIRNLRVRPEPLEGCNNLANTCYGRLVLDYDIYPLSPGTPGIVSTEGYKPRTTRYALRAAALTFPVSRSSDILLPRGTSLRLQIPADSTRISFSLKPDNLANETEHFRAQRSDGLALNDTSGGYTYLYSGDQRQFVWSGEKTLAQFGVGFEREERLDVEIISFVGGLQQSLFTLLASPDGLAFVFVAAVMLVAVVWLHSLHLK